MLKKKMKRLTLCILAFLVGVGVWADEAATDSLGLPTDLHASLLVCDAGDDFYSGYGHCALRMECPSMGLDFVFSYYMEDNFSNRTRLFRGNAVGSYVAMKTPSFLKEYEMYNRGVEVYELNLTLDQKRQLWQLLDQEVARKTRRPYNYLHTNCSSMSIYAVERVLADERIVCDSYDDGITGTYRHFIGRISEDQPWAYFFWTTILGAHGDTNGNIEDKMAPMLIRKSLLQMRIVDAEGHERPFVVGQPATLLPHGFAISPAPFTPSHLFLLVLLLAVAVSLWQLAKPQSARWPAFAFDGLLLTFQTLIGLFLFYISCISHMEGAAGNWNLLVFNPLPLLLWLLFRHRCWYGRVFGLYVAVLVFYVCLWPFSPQVDALRIWMVSPLLVRSVCLFWSAERHYRACR